MENSKDQKAAAEPPLDCNVGHDLTMPDFLRNQRNLVAEKDTEIERLRKALEKIADWQGAWGPYPETSAGWRALAIVTAREAVPNAQGKPTAANELNEG